MDCLTQRTRGGGIGRALIQNQDKVRAQGTLDLHDPLGSEHVPRAIDVGGEFHPLSTDSPKLSEAKDLISPAVSQNRPPPVHERVKPAGTLDGPYPWS